MLTKKVSLVAALVLLGTLSAVAATARPTPLPSDDDAIHAIAKRMQEGWNAKSGAIFATPFAENADYVVINGMHIQGRPAIAHGHQQIFDTVYKESTLSLEVSGIRYLRPDVAVAHLAAHLDVTGGPNPHRNEATITLVLTKESGGWQIAAFQNTAVQAPPAH